MDEITGFAPVWRSDARILVLGTMPSVASLEQGFYYGHPRNAFWPIMASILGAEEPESISEKADMLKNAGIALWDVARSCVRRGSLDSDIKHVRPNEILELLALCPNIKRVLFNGQKARELYVRHIGLPGGVEYMTLPSTSPAYTLNYNKKLEAWRKAITLEEYNERR
ncbi:MAG: DNA-deoxyinosine glycosylase [Clostridia bacterium]|nr:DNA-deoxyinosine glycosylase [Clostridia bacterium]